MEGGMSGPGDTANSKSAQKRPPDPPPPGPKHASRGAPRRPHERLQEAPGRGTGGSQEAS